MDRHDTINILSLCSGYGGLDAGLDIATGGSTRVVCHVRGKHLPPRSWLRAWRTYRWMLRLSGATCEPSMADHGVASWIASLADTRANRSRTQGSGLARTMIGIYGRRSLASLAKCSPASCSSRTSPDTSLSALMLFAPTSNASGTELRRDCSRRQRLAHRIAASDCLSSVWPTPNAASDNRNRGTGVDPKVRAEQGRQIMLQDVVKVWPTPRTITGGAESAIRKQELGRTASGGSDLQAASQAWPTPSANDHKGSAAPGQRRRQLSEATEQAWPTPASTMTAGEDLRATWMPGSKPVRDDGKTLQNALTTCSQIWDRSRPDRPTLTHGDGSSTHDQTSRPRLNPQFVEWLMGVPVGWTDFAPLETAWFRCRQRMHSRLCMLVSAVSSTVHRSI